MVVNFAKRMDMAVVSTYFKKKDKHRVTCKSDGKSTQVDNGMCRRRDLKEMCDCKVMMNECVAKQHRIGGMKNCSYGAKEKGRKSKAKDKMVETDVDKLSQNV